MGKHLRGDSDAIVLNPNHCFVRFLFDYNSNQARRVSVVCRIMKQVDENLFQTASVRVNPNWLHRQCHGELMLACIQLMDAHFR